MINTDNKTDNHGLLFADLTYKIRGCAFTVFNTLGFGHKELVYQKALVKEFGQKQIPFEREVALNVKYGQTIVGNYRPDFIVNNQVIIELKALEYLPKSSEQQILHYLKTTGFRLGLLINFGSPKLYIKRLIW